MRLYHTGRIEIRLPDLRAGRKNADFGPGFYLTPDMDFILRWAGADTVVNEYELDETGLRIHRFRRDEEWLRYILDNRRATDRVSADIVAGPVANDTIFDTLGIISSGFLKDADALKLLAVGPEYTQVAVKTEKALKQLRFIRSVRIEKLDGEQRRAEQEAYDAAFTEALRDILGE